MFCILKKIYLLATAQNITESVKTSYSFNDSKREGCHYLAG